MLVAPARERGLKFIKLIAKRLRAHSRSREGAWIEIYSISFDNNIHFCRSREGAWIEMFRLGSYMINGLIVAPARERGLKFRSLLAAL